MFLKLFSAIILGVRNFKVFEILEHWQKWVIEKLFEPAGMAGGITLLYVNN